MRKRALVLVSCLYFIPSLLAMSEEEPLVPFVRTFGFTAQGKRKTNQDRYVIQEVENRFGSGPRYRDNLHCTAIFDGHAGDNVAQMAKEFFFTFFKEGLGQDKTIKKSLKYACNKCEELSKEDRYQYDGSTVLATCFDARTKELFLLWLGDSKGWCSADCRTSFSTSEHNCTNGSEIMRVVSANGKIDDHDRLNGIIAVTRSLGDAFGKKTTIPQVSAEPECATWNVSKRFDDGDFQCCGVFVGASDGFWGVLKNKTEAALEGYVWSAKNLSHEKFYEKYLTRNEDDDLMSDEEVEHEVNIAQRLCYIAVSHLGSADNTTVIVQLFGEDPWLFNVESESFSSSHSTRSEDGDDSGEGTSGEEDDNSHEAEKTDLSEININPKFLDESLAALNALENPEIVEKREGENEAISALLTNEDTSKPEAVQDDSTPDKKSTKQQLKQQKNFFESLWESKRYLAGGSFAILLLTIVAYNYYKYGWSHCVTA